MGAKRCGRCPRWGAQESEQGVLCRDCLADAQAKAGLTLPQKASAPKGSAHAERQSLPFRPLSEAIKDAPDEPDWFWDGYVGPQILTLFGGPAKVGKSTTLFGLLGAMERGEAFLDRDTRKARALILSEERPGTLKEKHDRFRFDPHILLRHEQNGKAWHSIVEEAVAYCKERDLSVLVIDTWDKFIGLRGDQENQSGSVTDRLMPLLMAAGDGLAVIVVTHHRKSGGEHGDAVRGSNALVGGVDVVVGLERAKGEVAPSARVLTADSRYMGTPEELGFTLEGQEFEPHDPDLLRADQELRMLREASEELGKPASANEFANFFQRTDGKSLAEGTIRKRLTGAVEDGGWSKTGEGVSGDPHRFQCLSARSQPLGAERNDALSEQGPSAANQTSLDGSR
jgi:predicted ATP-dependent serine protease